MERISNRPTTEMRLEQLKLCPTGMLTQSLWSSFNTAQQQFFMNITSDAGFLQVDLNGLTVTGIEMSKNGQKPSELELAGNTNGLIQWLTGSSAFTSYSQNGAVGTPHAGYTGNYRQTVFSWSMQINTNTNGAEIDIDPLNPSDSLIGLIGHGLWQVLPNLLTGGDTDPNKTLKALQNRHINVPQCQ